MARRVYEDNFGYYDLEADPDEADVFLPSSRARASRASACAAQSWSSCSRGAKPVPAASTRWNMARPSECDACRPPKRLSAGALLLAEAAQGRLEPQDRNAAADLSAAGLRRLDRKFSPWRTAVSALAGSIVRR